MWFPIFLPHRDIEHRSKILLTLFTKHNCIRPVKVKAKIVLNFVHPLFLHFKERLNSWLPTLLGPSTLLNSGYGLRTNTQLWVRISFL